MLRGVSVCRKAVRISSDGEVQSFQNEKHVFFSCKNKRNFNSG